MCACRQKWRTNNCRARECCHPFCAYVKFNYNKFCKNSLVCFGDGGWLWWCAANGRQLIEQKKKISIFYCLIFFFFFICQQASISGSMFCQVYLFLFFPHYADARWHALPHDLCTEKTKFIYSLCFFLPPIKKSHTQKWHNSRVLWFRLSWRSAIRERFCFWCCKFVYY